MFLTTNFVFIFLGLLRDITNPDSYISDVLKGVT
jgi:hypothetical protein